MKGFVSGRWRQGEAEGLAVRRRLGQEKALFCFSTICEAADFSLPQPGWGMCVLLDRSQWEWSAGKAWRICNFSCTCLGGDKGESYHWTGHAISQEEGRLPCQGHGIPSSGGK